VLRDQVVARGIAPERIIVMPNAADPERFRADVSGAAVRERLGLRDARVVGFSGAFYPWHGVALILDALPRLLERVPNAALLLIGEGPERATLEARAKREGLGDRIRFCGWVTHDELPAHLAAFDVAVMPDSNEYGSPMKIYEYMAMGKPVVAPRLGPLADGIVDGTTGLLFARGNVGALGDALARLLAIDADRAAMGRAAAEHVRRNHTWDRNASRALERLAAARPGVPGAGGVQGAPGSVIS
jgi:glycosyltransferase involved in cell wall biosynthesis